MSKLTLVDLSKISREIYSSYLCKNARDLTNIPTFFNRWNYIEKLCEKSLLKDEAFLSDVESLIEKNIKREENTFYIKDSSYLQFEVVSLASKALEERYKEIVEIIKKSSEIYYKYYKKFIDERIINFINAATSESAKYFIHYEAFNLFYSLFFEFVNTDYEAVIKKALEYVYIICDADMMKVLFNNKLKYEDFCYMCIYSNSKLNDNPVIRPIKLDKIPELYQSIRIYD